MKIAIGGDHAGFEYKQKIAGKLSELGFDLKDFGSYSPDSVDYPDYVHPVALGVESGQFDFGVLVCGSGNGVGMTANKHGGIRAAICWSELLATLARQHNNANIICIPARFISYELAEEIVRIFLDTEFEGGRHKQRVDKISC